MNGNKQDPGLEDRVGGLLVLCGLIILIVVAIAIAGIIKMCGTQWP